MSVSSQLNDDGKNLSIMIDGRFDFSLHSVFRDAYRELAVKPETVTIDLSNVSYLDSAALGMLLLLRDYIGSGDRVALVNTKGDVKKTLETAKFERLFKLQK